MRIALSDWLHVVINENEAQKSFGSVLAALIRCESVITKTLSGFAREFEVRATNLVASNLGALPPNSSTRGFHANQAKSGFVGDAGLAEDPRLAGVADEGRRRMPGRSHREDVAEESLVDQILSIASDIERQRTAGALDYGDTLRLVADRTLTLTSASGVAIGLVQGGELVCRAAAGIAPDIGARVALEKGLSGECIRGDRMVRLDDSAEDARVDQAVCHALSLRSAMVVPIHSAGNVIGVLEVFSAKSNAFDDGAALAMSRLARFIGEVANPTLEPPQIEAVPVLAPSAAAPRSATPAESSHTAPLKLRLISSRRLRTALLIVVAPAIAVSAAYRVRETIRSTPLAPSTDEVNTPAGPPFSGGEATSPGAVATDPASAREDDKHQATAASAALEPAENGRRSEARTPNSVPVHRTETPFAPLSRPTTEYASEPAGEQEIAPSPPALALVQPAAQRDSLIAPLMNAPVADPQLAATQVTPQARSDKPRLRSRILGKPKKLKLLLGKDSKKALGNPQPQRPESVPQDPNPVN